MRADDGVSSVVGTVLMLGTTVVVFSALSLYALSYMEEAPRPPRAELAVVREGDLVLLRHDGGEAVHLGQGWLTVRTPDGAQRIPLTDPSLADQTADGARWRIGETLCLSCVVDGTVLEVVLVTGNQVAATLGADPAALPDLAVQALVHGPLAPGQPASFTATVANLGPLEVSFDVVLLVGGEPAGDPVPVTLPGGATADVVLGPWQAVAGEHEAQAVADPTGQVLEADGGNNAFTLTITVAEDP